MKIIVGLGNPGKKYEETRHNIGFLFLDYLAREFGAEEFQEKAKFKAMVTEAKLKEDKVLLVKPLTFMNLSGETLVALKNFYKLENEDFLICYDDVDLPFEKIRYRDEGSAGTHNGMRSIIGLLGSQDVPRLRFGVEVKERRMDLASFVLSRFSAEEIASLSDIFTEGLEILTKSW